ncbi:DUF4157 domain-containing protein [Streptomyces sp. NPDC051644]|uniref:DUF4157 domain-containing protein n=1 Tax=Streptomyces sp. NPDC051644 TaxID=3365666 RepID=UPI00378E47B4
MRVVSERRAQRRGQEEEQERRAADRPFVATLTAPDLRAPAGPLTPAMMDTLQRTVGNAAATRVLERHRHTQGPGVHGPGGSEDVGVQRSSPVLDELRRPGHPLRGTQRARLEADFGEDLSSVRLHTDARAQQSAAGAGARAYTSGEHIVLGEGGMDAIEHEVTHVIQQRRGSVAGSDNGQGLKVSHPSDVYEREAEANARRIRAGGRSLTFPGPAGVTAAPAAGAGVAVQRYVDVQPGAANYPTKHRRTFGFSTSADSDDEFFPSQQEVGGSYFANADDRTPNIVYGGNVALRFSDNYDLAIEQGAGESKVFFATAEHIEAANNALAGRVRLHRGSHYLRVQGQSGELRLHQVKPEVTTKAAGLAGKAGATKKTTGLSVLTPQRCNEMAEFVTGRKGISAEGITAWENFLARVLDLVDDSGSRHLDGMTAAFQRGVDGDHAAYLSYSQNMSRRFQNLKAANSPALEEALRQLGLNEFLPPPAPGAALVTVGYGDAAQETARDRTSTFEYHYGSAVATSGSDYVTMENYARRDANVGNSTGSGGDPLFFFKMYGTDPGSGETWHSTQVATNGFIGAILSITLEG